MHASIVSGITNKMYMHNTLTHGFAVGVKIFRQETDCLYALSSMQAPSSC